MSETWLHLHPWPGEPAPEGVTVKARARLEDSHLEIGWVVGDPLGVVDWPAVSSAPERRDGLWEATCLEAFRAGDSSEAYEELNLSPEGHWQIYAFANYRAGCLADPGQERPTVRFKAGRGVRLVSASWLLARPQAVIRVGLTAMIRTREGTMSCWALRHPGAQPDFHLAEARMLELVSRRPD